MSTADRTSVSDAQADALFADLVEQPALVLAVSGGPDSTALLLLAARWRARRRSGPDLLAVTVDHALRPDSAAEAASVKQLAKTLGVKHRTLRWNGRKPKSGLQEAARIARYRLLAQAAREIGATHVLTAHTLDDQAETVLLRLARGSGVTGLTAMARATPLAVDRQLTLVRPLLDIPKARLVGTLKAAKIPFAMDPSNRDPRFTRSRLRRLMPRLAAEGLDAKRLALLSHRLRRAETALEAVVDAALPKVSPMPWLPTGSIVLAVNEFRNLPDEIALRILGRAIGQRTTEGAVELGKLEELHSALKSAHTARFRRTLAGAMVTLSGSILSVEAAPPRRPIRARKPQTTRPRRAGSTQGASGNVSQATVR